MTHTIVETYDGSTAFRKDCRHIKGDFYIKDKQCFNINGTWYRVNSGFITFDYETQRWVVIKDTPSIVKGIISYDINNNDAIMGYFTSNNYRNVRVVFPNGQEYTCLDYKILPKGMFEEDAYTMKFYHVSIGMKSKKATNSFGNNGYPLAPPYCVKHYPPEVFDMFSARTKESIVGYKPDCKLSDYVSNLNNYSFGFEFETCTGKIPNWRIMESGLLPLRDGSINGIEFATIPLSGKQGLAILERACKMLAQYTTISENESLHLHLGNIPTSKKFIGYMYTVCCILEKEIYSLFPKYYAQTSKFKARGKDYNMPLKKEFVAIDPVETFDNLAFYLNEGKKFQGFGANHPSDPNDEHKWNIQCRYHWVNFIPLLFGTNKTLEFRCHVPTRDIVKVLNWLYICSAMIQYVDNLSRKNVDLDSCRGLTLSKVISETYGNKLSSHLLAYIRQRKEERVINDEMGDLCGTGEIKEEMKNNSRYKDIS